MLNLWFFHKYKGQSLPEYGLVLGLVVVASIGALILLGSNISGTTETVSSELANSSVEMAYHMAMNKNSDPTSMPQLLSQLGYAGETKTLSFTTPSGSTVVLSDYPVDLAESLETLGSPGVTEVLAALMKETARQLVEQGDITTEQAINLVNLANKGYQISEVEGLLATEALNNPLETSYMGSLVTYNGYTYQNPYDMSNQLLTPAGNRNQGYAVYTTSSLVDDYNALLATAQSDGSLSIPAVNSLISNISNDILYLSNEVSINNYAIMRGHLTPAMSEAKIASQTTETHSDTICSTGNHTNQGLSCS